MKIDIPQSILQEMVDCNLIQTHWNIQSAEARWQQVQRLEYHIVEYVIAVIGKEMRNRKMLPYNKQ